MKTCITKGIVTVSLTAILLSCSSAWAAGKGGIGLAATRLVYSEGEEQISLGVRNTSPDVPYLIQSWVMTPDNKKSAGSGHTRPNNMPSSNSGGNGKPPALPTNQKPLALPDKQNSDSSQSIAAL